MEPAQSHKVSFATFFALWAETKRWDVPDVHWRAVHWLEHCGDHAVMRCFRGFGKSTLLASYNAWRYYCEPTYRILHQGADDQMAYKTSRDTQGVLRQHPLTEGMLPSRPGPVEQWWVEGASDERNASMFAKGITSTTTSSRADECQNDDVEVPKNIQNPEAREKMRARLNEQIHIMVPGARHLFIGTPHTHDSLYDEQQRLGADCLTIRMFGREHRIELATEQSYALPFAPDMVFSGIGEGALLLVPGRDYVMQGLTIRFRAPPAALVDCYADSAWPERFTPAEMVKRRRKTRTINEWDSQYQLHSKPISDTRLDPDRLIPYADEPVIRMANGQLTMMLGRARIVGATFRWDPASGKLTSDVSAWAMVLQDEEGRRYIHRLGKLLGDIVTFGDDGRTIIGGQALQLAQVAKEFSLPCLTVETNGIGKLSPAVLKGAFRQANVQCRIKEETAVLNKNRRILESLEPLLLSHDQLWAHVSVLDGPLPQQMRDWNPAVKEQPDDYLDVVAGAVTEAPERIQKGRGGAAAADRILPADGRDDWRPRAGIQAVELTAD